MAKKSFFISTAIPYVNAKPHIGFALELLQADVIARYHRALGEDVFFLSGTDENAIKNVQAAEAAGMEVLPFVKKTGESFVELVTSLNISTNDFIKTSQDERHTRGAQKLWSNCKKEDIYKKTYKGLYCTGCEEFKTAKDLVNGECEEHPGKKIEEVEEENYFFKLSNYQKQLEALIESDTLQIIPETRKNETLAFIRGGLEDFSISRSNLRAKNWGVPVPGDNTQMMYVWFDALSNYINALGYADESENYKKYWVEGETMHLIGKGINRFHTIYWPAMLLSAGVPLPKRVMIHGYIVSGGQKMSKSLGNVIDPLEMIEEYGADAVRLALLRHIPTFEDGDFTPDKMKEIYNADLVNGIGNLTSRIMKMAVTYGVALGDKIGSEWVPLKEKMNNLNLSLAINEIWIRIAFADGFIQREEPFKKIKINPEEAKENVLFLLSELMAIAKDLEVFLPSTAQKIISLVKENKMPEAPLFPRKD
jgi:methionyl-tRNA synthetase